MSCVDGGVLDVGGASDHPSSWAVAMVQAQLLRRDHAAAASALESARRAPTEDDAVLEDLGKRVAQVR